MSSYIFWRFSVNFHVNRWVIPSEYSYFSYRSTDTPIKFHILVFYHIFHYYQQIVFVLANNTIIFCTFNIVRATPLNSFTNFYQAMKIKHDLAGHIS